MAGGGRMEMYFQICGLVDDVSRLLIEMNEAWKIRPTVDHTLLPKGKAQANNHVPSSASALAKAAATKNKGHASIEEVAAATTLCSFYPVTQDPDQGCGVPREKQRLPKPPRKKMPRLPLVVPVVGSPGVNVMLSQASPRFGVKRSSPTLPQIPRQKLGLVR
ncbi:hypothetical protein ZWY2020_041778 [Hordeum vulgare]|nr:hypothetical protein ZWY2020_041778 [Hordeum vulgare]